MMRPRWLKDMVRLRLEPDDILIMRFGRDAYLEEVARSARQVHEATGRKVIVTIGDVEIGAIGQAEPDQRNAGRLRSAPKGRADDE